MSRPLVLLPLVLLGCAQTDAMRYIPPQERTLLQAEARLGDTPGRVPSGGRISVDELLGRARTAEPAAATSAPLVVRFAPDAVQPDADQRAAIGRATLGAGRVVVVGRRAALTGPDALLGQRRAVAVARLLEPTVPEVELRFEPNAPADQVVVIPDGGRAP